MPILTNMLSVLTESGRSLKDFLFPPSCLVCGSSCRDGEFICTNCWELLRDNAETYTPDRDIPPEIDAAVVLLPYDDACRSLVHALKYHGMQDVGPLLGRMMAEKLLRHGSFAAPPLIVPVPLHERKLTIRGYNQAERLAEGIEEYTGYAFRPMMLKKIRHTSSQTAHDEEKRRNNVKGVFRCHGGSSLRGRPVILVDDVMTTGSTLSECALALKQSGAADITAVVIATPDMGPD